MAESCWDFDAPKFVDFAKEDDEGDTAIDEHYFSYDHEAFENPSATESLQSDVSEDVCISTYDSQKTLSTPGTFCQVAAMESKKQQKIHDLTEIRLEKNMIDIPEEDATAACDKEKVADTAYSRDESTEEKYTDPDVMPHVIRAEEKPAGNKEDRSDVLKAETAAGAVQSNEKLEQGGTKDESESIQTHYTKNISLTQKHAAKCKQLQGRKLMEPTQTHCMKLREKIRHCSNTATVCGKGKLKQPQIKEEVKNRVQLVMPITPTVLKHQRHAASQQVKTREERELEEIELLKYEQRERLKESQKSFKVALKGPTPHPVAHTKTTKFKEFKFKTDERVKLHGLETTCQKLPLEVDFAKSLRRHPPSPGKLTCTVVRPFNFSDSRKRKLVSESNKGNNGLEFKPLAKAVADFQKCTRSLKIRKSQKGPMKTNPFPTITKSKKMEANCPPVCGNGSAQNEEIKAKRHRSEKEYAATLSTRETVQPKEKDLHNLKKPSAQRRALEPKNGRGSNLEICEDQKSVTSVSNL